MPDDTDESTHCLPFQVGVESVLLPPTDEQVGQGRLPCWRYPSDHISLQATLRLPDACLVQCP